MVGKGCYTHEGDHLRAGQEEAEDQGPCKTERDEVRSADHYERGRERDRRWWEDREWGGFHHLSPPRAGNASGSSSATSGVLLPATVAASITTTSPSLCRRRQVLPRQSHAPGIYPLQRRGCSNKETLSWTAVTVMDLAALDTSATTRTPTVMSSVLLGAPLAHSSPARPRCMPRYAKAGRQAPSSLLGVWPLLPLSSWCATLHRSLNT